MPKNFTGILDSPIEPASRRDPYLGDVTGTAKELNNAIQIGAKLQDSRILNKYSADAQALEGATAQYSSTVDDLVLKEYNASLANDARAVAEYRSQMQRLRSGELNGVLSPTAANIRLQTLTKEWATRYPHLTGDFKTLYNESATGLARGAGAEPSRDPTAKGMDKLMEKAAEKSMTVGAYVEMERMADQATYLDNLVKKKAALGEGFKPELEEWSNTVVRASVDTALHQMQLDLKRGTLSKVNYAVALNEARTLLGDKMNQQFSEQEKTTGVRLDPAWKEATKKAALGPFDDLMKASAAADSVNAQSEFLTMREKLQTVRAKDLLTRILGPFRAEAVKYPPLAKAIESVSARAQALSTGASAAEIWDILHKDDKDTLSARMMLGEEGYRVMTEEAMKMLIDDRTPLANVFRGLPPEAARAGAAVVEPLMHMGGLPPQMYQNLPRLMAEETPDRVAKNKSVVGYLKTDAATFDSVKQTLGAKVLAAGQYLDGHKFDYLKVGPQGVAVTKILVDPESVGAAVGDAGTPIPMFPFMADPSVTDDRVRQLAAALNDMHSTIRAVSGPEVAEQEVSKALQEVINDRTASSQKPTQAQTEAAAKGTAGLTKLEDGIYTDENGAIVTIKGGKLIRSAK